MHFPEISSRFPQISANICCLSAKNEAFAVARRGFLYHKVGQLANTIKVAQVLNANCWQKLEEPPQCWFNRGLECCRSNSGKLCKFNATKLCACLPASDLCGQNHDRAHSVCIMRYLMSRSNKPWMYHNCNSTGDPNSSLTLRIRPVCLGEL